MNDQTHTEQRPGFTIVDKREQRRHAAQVRKVGQEQFVRQAAGTLFWEAEYAASTGQPQLADLTLAKRAELIEGARRQLGDEAVAGLV